MAGDLLSHFCGSSFNVRGLLHTFCISSVEPGNRVATTTQPKTDEWQAERCDVIISTKYIKAVRREWDGGPAMDHEFALV